MLCCAKKISFFGLKFPAKYFLLQNLRKRITNKNSLNKKRICLAMLNNEKYYIEALVDFRLSFLLKMFCLIEE